MRRLAIKVGEFQNQQGETKGEYMRLGVIGESQNGEYVLLDPAVNLAGALTRQNMMNHKAGRKPSDKLMVSVFDDSQQQGGQQQRQQPQGQQPAQQNQNQNQSHQNAQPAPPQGEPDFDFDDSGIPF